MRLCRSSILIVTSLTCFANPSLVDAATRLETPLFLATQAQTPVLSLSPDSQGADVRLLQTHLRELGYYKGVVDGNYGASTSAAVTKFQSSEGLTTDGIAGTATRERIKATIAKKASVAVSPTPQPTTQPETSAVGLKLVRQSWLWWLLVIGGVLATSGILFYLLRSWRRPHKTLEPLISDQGRFYLTQEEVTPPIQDLNALPPQETLTTSSLTELLPAEKTSRLAKVNIVEELVKDLQNPEPVKRHKAIWDLASQGDSRAIQPLLMIDSDSQQRSLILATLSEIGVRTLKPMNRALAISLQDESPEVRKNAIRDLTRVYDMMAQISQMLCHALEDTNPEVQETARYALSQMNRIRSLPGQEEGSDS
jgi:peptidoglycan hydrolase-like protein with peptidoglycan-binding domain